MRLSRFTIGIGTLIFSALVGVGLWAANPPVADIVINGHTYTNAQLEANPAGWIAGIANDIGAITSQYPKGRFAPRVALTADLTMFVDPNGSDLNNCLVANPCKTIQHAFDVLRDGYDFAGFVVTVQLSNGSYTPGLICRSRMIGQQSPASLILKGNSASPSLVTVQDLTVPSGFYERGDGTAIYANFGCQLTVDGVKVVGGFRGIWANSPGSEIRMLNVEVGSAQVQLAASLSAMLRVRGNYSISGNAVRSHWLATEGGKLYGSDFGDPQILPVVTVIGNPTIPIFAQAQRHGEVVAIAAQTSFVEFGGGAVTVTGQKFTVDTLGLIHTNGSGVNYLPGSAAGTITSTTYGVYD